MKKILFFLPFILCLPPSHAQDHRIKLESPVIQMADGSFINADKIEFIRKLRRTLLTIILGDEQPNGQRKGNGVQHWAQLEKEVANSCATPQEITKRKEELKLLLVIEKEKFSSQLNEFVESGRGAKKIFIALIEEECAKRFQPDSLLLEWAKTKEGSEPIMFEERIQSFADYYHFCTDLVNFLFDLTHSCPKAEMQFKDRVAKWSAVKSILPTVMKKAHVKTEAFNEIEFLKYLKERYLDKISIEEITPQIILPLLTEYLRHRNNA